jgi:threonine synthase
VEPASAASIAGLKKLINSGKIDRKEQIVCVVTGHVLKDPQVAINACEDPVEVDADINALSKIIKRD